MVNYNDVPPSEAERMMYMENRELDPEKMAKLSPAQVKDAMSELLFQVPYDARFPHTQQTRRCPTYYTDYYRCRELLGIDYKPCEYFKSLFKVLCSTEQLEKLEAMRKSGTFPARFDR